MTTNHLRWPFHKTHGGKCWNTNTKANVIVVVTVTVWTQTLHLHTATNPQLRIIDKLSFIHEMCLTQCQMRPLTVTNSQNIKPHKDRPTDVYVYTYIQLNTYKIYVQTKHIFLNVKENSHKPLHFIICVLEIFFCRWNIYENIS